MNPEHGPQQDQGTQDRDPRHKPTNTSRAGITMRGAARREFTASTAGVRRGA